MPTVFISHRQADTRQIAGRLYGHLASTFGQAHVLMNVEDIPAWVDVTEHLRDQIDQCDIMLVIVGPLWISARNAQGIRCLESPEDVVRREIEMGQHRALPLILVLVDDAPAPSIDDLPPSLRAVSRAPRLIVRPDPHFRQDAQWVVNQIAHHTHEQSDLAQAESVPPAATRWFNEGYAQVTAGAYARAISSFTRALKLEYAPQSKVYAVRGWAYYKLGEFIPARDDMDIALELDPTHAQTYLNRGFVHRELGEYEQAIADFDRALEHGLDPPGWAYHNRGTVYRLMGQPGYAIADFKRALAVNPELANPYWGLGNVHHDRGEYEAALRYYRRYLDSAGNEADVTVRLLVEELERRLAGTE